MTEVGSEEISGTTTLPSNGKEKSFFARLFRFVGRGRDFVESPPGVYTIVLAILILIIVLTLLFTDGFLAIRFLPLYEADAEMLLVAAAVLVVAYELRYRVRK